VSNAAWEERRKVATPRGIGIVGDFYAARAENAVVWDIEGKRYLDFAGGIAVLNTGHRHPQVVAAVERQLAQFSHTAYQSIPYASYVELAEKLNARTPGNFAKKTALVTTGAEAVENAVKFARAATGRAGVIAFGGSFHGRTMMGMALTGKVAPYKLAFGPFPGEVYHLPFPNELQGVTVDQVQAALEHLFKADIDPARVAAIIIEPVQGEGGFNIAPPALMRHLRQVCDSHGIVLIADEIQTGFGRTGKLFAMEHYDVVPDLITMAKSMAGGLPLAAVTGRAEIMDAPAPGGLGGTFAGNPLAVAAAHAVLDVIDGEGLCERADMLGALVKDTLHGLRRSVPRIADVRGLGSMVALELRDPDSGAPDAEFTARVRLSAQRAGLLLLSCGVYGNVIRFLYPLTIETEQLREGLAILARALQEPDA
jgi:4-aminobutyrate aminotransferase